MKSFRSWNQVSILAVCWRLLATTKDRTDVLQGRRVQIELSSTTMVNMLVRLLIQGLPEMISLAAQEHLSQEMA
jgi:hypothetical protein